MKITGWHIDGFGVHRDYEVAVIGPGLTVFVGPNEAGKTTLLAFLRAMLFGFLDGRSNEPKYEPEAGVRHGGRLSLEDGTGGQWTIDRGAGTARGKATMHVTVPGSALGSRTDLAQLLGSCDRKVFQSVFAVGLDELQSMSALADPEVRDRLVATGLVGSGNSPGGAISEIDKRQRGAKKAVEEVDGRLRDIEPRLLDAHRMALAYPAARAEEAARGATVVKLEKALMQARVVQTGHQRLIDLWSTWCDLRAADLQVARLEGVAGTSTVPDASAVGEGGTNRPIDDRIAAVAAAVASLHEELALHRTYLDDRRPNAEERLRQSTAALDAILRRLGPDWNRERVAAFDQSIPRGEEVRAWDERLHQMLQAVTDADSQRRRAGQDLERAEAALGRARDDRAALPEELTSDAIGEMESAARRVVAGLRALAAASLAVQARDQVVRDQERLLGNADAPAASNQPGWAVPVLTAVAIVLLGGAGWRALGADAAGAASLGVVGVLAGVLAWRSRATGIRATVAADRARRQMTALRVDLDAAIMARTQAAEQLRSVEAELAEGAHRLDLAAVPTELEAENAVHRVADLRTVWDEARRHDARIATLTAEVGDRTIAARGAREQAEEADRLRRSAETDWLQWQQDRGLTGSQTPVGVLTLFGVINEGQAAVQAVRNAEQELEQVVVAIHGFEARCRAVAVDAGIDASPTGHAIPILVELLQARVDQDLATRRERDDSRRISEACQRRIQQQVGSDIDDVVRQLETGRLLDWLSTVATAEARIAELEEERTIGHGNLALATDHRRTIESYADLHRLETERAALEEELNDGLRQVRVLAIAAELLTRTLTTYERERQPAVLQHATTLFKAVTDGAYVQILPDPDTATLRVEPRLGPLRLPEQLSRGTREQLYLCLRLGLAQDYAGRSEPMPLVMDDVLVNFDPVRARAMAGVLCEVARDHQVLLFTCHQRTADLMREIDGTCGQVVMERYGGRPQAPGPLPIPSTIAAS